MSPSDHSPPETDLFSRIHAALPQTQCTRCGYPDCAAYAHAIAYDGAPINQCPPGGEEGIGRLAAITGSPALPLNPAYGVEGPRAVAVIDEAWCIGCTLCLPVCPTDAIFGSNKLMHSVLESHCTGCELCIPVCPVDCISLENVTGDRTGWSAWSPPEARKALERYQIHSDRRLNNGGQDAITLKNSAKTALMKPDHAPLLPETALIPAKDEAAQKKRAVIEAAIARARAARKPGL